MPAPIAATINPATRKMPRVPTRLWAFEADVLKAR
jgi:hypothetical protein